MPYMFKTKSRDGKPHPRWKFQYTDWQGKRRSATGTTSKVQTEKLAQRVQAEQDAIRKRWQPAPKNSDTPRAFREVMEEYLCYSATA